MTKSPKARKPVGTARHTATSGQNKSGLLRGERARQNDQATAWNGTKKGLLIKLLGSARGASVSELADKSGWQHHSVRGFLSGTVKKKLGLALSSEQVEGRGRVYRIA